MSFNRHRLLRPLTALAVVGVVSLQLFREPRVVFACGGGATDTYSPETPCSEAPGGRSTFVQQAGRVVLSGAAVYGVYRLAAPGLSSLRRQKTLPADEQPLPLYGLAERRAEELGILAALIRSAGLTAQYQEGGPYTLFWPTDVALRKALGQVRVERLLEPGHAPEAAAFLRAFTVRGVYRYSSLKLIAAQGTLLRTLGGETLSFSDNGERIFVNGVPLLQADYPASNGWLLQTDGVLPGAVLKTP